jgi:transcriptional regulator with XRE-family HTH domain
MAESELQLEALRILRAERLRQGLTQLQVASRMVPSVSLSVFQRLEYGDRDVRASTLERYAKALGKKLEVYLVDDPEAEP